MNTKYFIIKTENERNTFKSSIWWAKAKYVAPVFTHLSGSPSGSAATALFHFQSWASTLKPSDLQLWLNRGGPSTPFH
jgi:hypothetical protein